MRGLEWRERHKAMSSIKPQSNALISATLRQMTLRNAGIREDGVVAEH